MRFRPAEAHTRTRSSPVPIWTAGAKTARSSSTALEPPPYATKRKWKAASDESPGDDRTALFRIDVIEIPVNEPAKARIVDSPAVSPTLRRGGLAGLWKGGDHGDDTQETYQEPITATTSPCFPSVGSPQARARANGILFDVSDPLNPKRIDEVVDKGFAYWHSRRSTTTAPRLSSPMSGGGGARPRCRAYDPLTWGADAIYDIVDGKLEFRAHYKMPAPQLEEENCVAHNGSIVPVPGRDIFVQAWYQGGLSLVDFTDSATRSRSRTSTVDPSMRKI